MALSQDIKRAVRSAFVYQSLGLEAAAKVGGASFGTASRWKREAKADGDDWDKARAAKMMSAEGAAQISQAIFEELILQYQIALEKLDETKDMPILARADILTKISDGYSKAVSAARKGSPEINKLAVGMDVIKLFAEFVGTKYPQHAGAFIEMLEPFGQHLSESFA